MSNNLDPFYGHVTYIRKDVLDGFSNPMASIDGMIIDIKKDCQDIQNLRYSNISDREYRIEAYVRDIVKLFQAICYLRLHECAYLNTPDRLFFGTVTPLDESDLDGMVPSSEMWNDLLDLVNKVAGTHNEPPNVIELLGSEMGKISDICDTYQGILTMRRHRR